MKANKIYLSIILILSVSVAFSQNPTLLTNLDPLVSETSGLVFVNGKLWTHNDSGNEAILYCIDTATGMVISQKTITNAINIDWEDISADGEYLYIGDFGNNTGQRNDLKIYKVLIEELNNEFSSSINSEIINFSYNSSYYPARSKNNDTDFDCEALIVKDDSIYLFSKNWVSKTCYLYSLPKETGTYVANRRDTLNTQGLICGADYNPETNTVCLIGYVYGIPAPSILFYLYDFEGNNFFDGTIIRHELSLNGYQTEGVTFRDNNRVWFSNENFLGNVQSLFEFQTPSSFIKNETQSIVSIYPNPTNDLLIIKIVSNEKLKYRIIDSYGKIAQSSCKKLNVDSEIKIDVSDLKSGTYIIEFYSNKTTFKKRFIKL